MTLWRAHGDDMVPLTRYSTVAGRAASRPGQDGLDHAGRGLDADSWNAPAKGGGGRSSPCSRRVSAFYAPASSAVAIGRELSEGQEARAWPCAAYLNGEYGVKDLYVGVARW